jgi:hypothetical protein
MSTQAAEFDLNTDEGFRAFIAKYEAEEAAKLGCRKNIEPLALDAVGIRGLLARLKPERRDDRSDWLAVGMALHAAGESVETWDQWSQQSDKWDAKCCYSGKSARVDCGPCCQKS